MSRRRIALLNLRQAGNAYLASAGGGTLPYVSNPDTITTNGGPSMTLSNGNRTCSFAGYGNFARSVNGIAVGTVGAKYYFETVLGSVYTPNSQWQEIGLVDSAVNLPYWYGSCTGNYGVGLRGNGGSYVNKVLQASGYGGAAANDVYMVAADFENGKVYFGKNGTWLIGDPEALTGGLSMTAGRTYHVSIGNDTGSGAGSPFTFNAGQVPMTHEANIPTGFTPGWPAP